MKKLKFTKAILAFVLVVSVVSSVASLPKLSANPSNGGISTQSTDDWGWMFATK